eukprot:7350352-Prymnesium_polylepis.1
MQCVCQLSWRAGVACSTIAGGLPSLELMRSDRPISTRLDLESPARAERISFTHSHISQDVKCLAPSKSQ